MLQVTLKVVGGELEFAEVPLRLPAVIGRGRDVEVNLSHPLVSRRHCELRETYGQLRVRDLGSLNGTFVGSERVVDAIVRPGDLLTVGTVTFRAVYTGRAEAAESWTVLEADERPRTAADTQLAPVDTVRVKSSRPNRSHPQPADVAQAVNDET